MSLSTSLGAEFTLAVIESQSVQAETFLGGFNEPTMEEKGAPENFKMVHIEWFGGFMNM